MVKKKDIARCKKIEVVLKESKQKFKMLAEQSPNMIFINKKGRVVYANKKCEEIIGYRRKEFYSPDFDFFTLIAPESRDLIKANFSRHMKGKEIVPYEYTLITRKGERIEAILTTKLIRYEGETAILGTVTDITERKEAKEALKESKSKAKILASYQHAISELRQFYVKKLTFKEMVRITLNLIVKDLGYYMAWYAELIEEEKVIIPKIWVGKYEKYLDGLKLKLEDRKDAKCAMSRCIVTKKPFGYADLEHDKDFEKWRPFALKYGYRSNQAIPLIIGGKCKSAFLIYSTKPGVFSQEAIRYLKGVTDELCIIVENITERKRAYKTLRESEEKYRALIESSGDAICVLNYHGRHLYANQACGDFFGKKPANLIGCELADLFPEQKAKEILRDVQLVFREKGILRRTHVLQVSGNICHISMTLAPILNDKRNVVSVVVTARDITERKKAEKKLQESEKRYRAIFEQAADSIVLIDAGTGELVDFNERAHDNLGYTREEFQKLKIPDFEVIESARQVAKHIKKIIRNGSDTFETKHRTKDGEIRDIMVNSRTIFIGGKTFIQSMWCDITERKKTEEELKNSQAREELAREQERHQFAMRVHDDLAQSLATLTVKAKLIKKSLPKNCKNIKKEITELDKIVKTTLQDTRKMIADLMVPQARKLQFIPTVRAYIQKFSKESNLPVRIKIEGSARALPPRYTYPLFYVIREALHNVVQHSQATKVLMAFRFSKNDLKISIEDNGCGFNLKRWRSTLATNEALGLIIIEERVKDLSGTLSIKTVPGKGTRLDISVPLKKSGK